MEYIEIEVFCPKCGTKTRLTQNDEIKHHDRLITRYFEQKDCSGCGMILDVYQKDIIDIEIGRIVEIVLPLTQRQEF